MAKTKRAEMKLVVEEDTLFDASLPALLLKADADKMVDQLVEAGEAGLSTIRALVESYYDVQSYRLQSMNRVRALTEQATKHGVQPFTGLPEWLAARTYDTERAVAKLLDQYTAKERSGLGAWAREIVGIGPIISAGLLALIDMNVATNPSKIWRFFGLDPTVRWEPGKKRPWNATGRVLSWKVGDSFVKVHNRPDAFYGHLYAQRKALEQERDAQGLNAALAAQTLAEKHFNDKDVIAVYKSGHLPKGRIEQRARRWAVKIFLVHWWQEAYRRKFRKEPPGPYVLDRLGHQGEIKPPKKVA